ncbi:MAG: lipoprotein [Nitrospiraceae bacterium]|jgi:TolA-binding protein|nr:MAG: lipoprotein [Nitrospiraceae bacterium]
MTRTVTGWFFALALAAASCTGNKADELFETAQFEEKQNNQAHAKELYEAILRDYPNSDAAKKAKDRLAALSHSR